jgi:predicted metal-dependent phosphoesterase TrpH
MNIRPQDADRKKGLLKVELHCHTSADPVDNLPLDIVSTIERAAELGYDAIAMTHHDAYYKHTDEALEASERTGVLVLPGVEATLDENGHVLIINCGSEVEGIETLDDLAAVRRPEHLVIAAHPYYPGFGLGEELLERYATLFDGIEWSHFWNHYTIRPNLRAHQFCRRHSLPLVGTGDIHLPAQMNYTYALVKAEKDPMAITRAIRAGDVELVTEPLSFSDMVGFLAEMTWRNQVTSSKFWRQVGREIVERGAPRTTERPGLSIPAAGQFALTPLRAC